jgi:Tfp pilus assembly protein PilF
MIALSAAPAYGSAANPSGIDPKVEQALLAENWQQVIDLLGPDEALKDSAVARLVKGHAYLAVNRNNESLCMFLSASGEEDLREWDEWANGFARRHPDGAIAHYLRGDALARLRQWDRALAEFGVALNIHPGHALILNARGVAYAIKSDWDRALADLAGAVVAAPSLADGHASLGTMWLHKKEGARGGLKAFDRALHISPDFGVAAYGRACLASVMGRYDDARTDFRHATDLGSCVGDLVGTDVLAALDRVSQQEQLVASIRPGDARMSVESSLDAVKHARIGSPEFKRGAVDLSYAAKDNRALIPMISNELDGLRRSDPGRGRAVDRAFAGGIRLNDFVASVADSFRGRTFAQTETAQVRITGSVDGAGVGPSGVAHGRLTAELGRQTEHTTSGKSFWGGPAELIHGSRDVADVQRQLLHGSGPKANGFKTSLEAAAWDDGKWPFAPRYGLLYQFADADQTARAAGQR